MRRFLYTAAQLTWGCIQTLAGFVVFLITLKCPHRIFHGAVCTSWKSKSSLSLGLFIFVSDDPFFYYEAKRAGWGYEEFFSMLAVHEYGHTIQSLFWGPLYLLTVGLPSIVWAMFPYFVRLREKNGISYFAVYPERQANSLGEMVTGRKSPGQIF